MKTPNVDARGFPELPGLKAKWAPLYLEPILDSGERLTVAIIVKSGSQAQIRSVLRPEAMRMLYGKHAGGLRGLVELTVDSLDAHLKENKTPASWKPPVTGFHQGEFRDAMSFSMDGIVSQAIQRCASLSSLQLLEIVQEATRTEQEQVTGRLVDRVRDAVSKIDIDLVRFFNQTGKLVEDGKPIRFGFLGKGVVAHFGQLRPARLTDTQFNARARLWELSRAQQQIDLVSGCLILQIPRKNDINFSSEEIKSAQNAYDELVEEAKSDELSVIKIHDEHDGAGELVKLAA